VDYLAEDRGRVKKLAAIRDALAETITVRDGIVQESALFIV